MSIVLAIGLAGAAVNLWALVDVLRHGHRDRAVWVPMTVAGLTCGASTAPFLVAVPIYTAMAYMAVGHPRRRVA